MSDLSGLPTQFGSCDVQVFKALGAADWQAWRRPIGKAMAMMLCMNSGGGGGGGMTSAAGTARGGGGGGSGAIAKLLIPLFAVPEIHYCNVALGGFGGNPAGIGSAGAISVISPAPAASSLRIINGGTSGGGAGQAGTVSAGGAAGSGGGAANINSGVFVNTWGVLHAQAGVAGTAGGAHTGANGGDGTFGANTLVINGGSGGGGTPVGNTDFRGGNLPSSLGGFFPAVPGGLAAAGRGGDGFPLFSP